MSRARTEAGRAAREAARAERVRPASRPAPRPEPGPRRPAAGSPEKPRDATALIPVAIVLAALLAYLGSFNGPFVFDDLRSIQGNKTIRSLDRGMLNPPGPRAVTNRPVVNASFALNYAIGGLEVRSFHATNLLIHVLAALLLFGIVRRTLGLSPLCERWGPGAPWIAGAVALLWVVHPLAGESVTYIVQRTESLMGLFYFLLIYCLVRSTDSRWPVAWLVGALVALALGLGSKEVMITAPLLALAYDRMFLASSFRESLRRRAPFYGAIFAGTVFVVLSTRIRPAILSLLNGKRARSFPVIPSLLTQCEILVHYLRLSFWPWPIAGDYDDWRLVSSLADTLPSVLLVVGLLAATAWAVLRGRRAGYLGLWFFGILAPTSLYMLRNELAADRRMYLPLAAVVALLVLGTVALVERLLPGDAARSRRRILFATLTVVLAAGLAWGTVLRIRDYRTPIAFWSRVVEVRPHSMRGNVNLAYYTMWTGDLPGALKHFEAAVRYWPKDARARFGLAVGLERSGRLEEAIEQYRAAIRIEPRYFKAHNNLGRLLMKTGRAGEASIHFARAMGRSPLAQAPREQGAAAPKPNPPAAKPGGPDPAAARPNPGTAPDGSIVVP